VRRFNSYYTVSIISLVFMAFIFIRTIQLQREEAGNHLAPQQVLAAWMGSYAGDPPLHLHAQGDTLLLDTNGVTWGGLLLSPFETDEWLLQPFRVSIDGQAWNRLDGCELLGQMTASGTFQAQTVGGLCFLAERWDRNYVLTVQLDTLSLTLTVAARDVQSDALLDEQIHRWRKEPTP